MKIQDIEFEDFKEFYIYDVPAGAILNAETYKQYPKKHCGTWLWDKDKNYMLQTIDDVNYQLINTSMNYDSWCNIEGTLSEVKEQWVKYLAENNEKIKINSNNKM